MLSRSRQTHTLAVQHSGLSLSREWGLDCHKPSGTMLLCSHPENYDKAVINHARVEAKRGLASSQSVLFCHWTHSQGCSLLTTPPVRFGWSEIPIRAFSTCFHPTATSLHSLKSHQNLQIQHVVTMGRGQMTQGALSICVRHASKTAVQQPLDSWIPPGTGKTPQVA
jgi:hypothetical protein